MELTCRLWSRLGGISIVFAASATPAQAQEVAVPLPLDMIVNGRDQQRLGLAIVHEGDIFVRIEDLRESGVVTPFDGDLFSSGEAYVRISNKPGLSARLEGEGTRLLLNVDVRHLPQAHFAGHERAIPVAPAVPAAFIDYDLTFMAQRGHARASAVVDAAVSGSWGVLTASFLADTTRKRPTRLDTAVVRDLPDRNLRVVLGDVHTRAAPWSQSVRFAGIRIGTEFSLDPSQITYPIPSLSGSALLPSTVELASQAFRRSLSVEPGRFALDYRPRFTGAGEVTMILRDLSGNERTVTRSFYASTALLRPGLSEFSVEAGALRRDYGRRSFSYGPPFAALSYRRGASSVLTLEARVEGDRHTRMSGAGATMVVQPLGELRFDLAASQGYAGTGMLYQIQFQRLAPRYAVTGSYRQSGAGFRQVGDLRQGRQRSRQMALAGSLALGTSGSLNAGYLRSEEDGDRRTATSLGYSLNLGRAFLAIGGQRLDSDKVSETSIFANLTLPLGGRRHLGAYADGSRISAALEQAVPAGRGWGYRLSTGIEGRDGGTGGTWLEGAASLRSPAGQWDAAASWRANGMMARLEARGALVAVGGQVAATPRVEDGLALVDLPGDARVTVLLENQPAAARAGGGRTAVVTGLQPYVANRISIEADALPIDGELGSVEQVVAPGWRQAARVTFGSREARPARLRLLDEAGTVVPPGLSVTIGGLEAPTVTGHDGEVFVRHYEGGLALDVDRGGQTSCRATLPTNPATDMLAAPVLLVCRSASNGEQR